VESRQVQRRGFRFFIFPSRQPPRRTSSLYLLFLASLGGLKQLQKQHVTISDIHSCQLLLFLVEEDTCMSYEEEDTYPS